MVYMFGRVDVLELDNSLHCENMEFSVDWIFDVKRELQIHGLRIRSKSFSQRLRSYIVLIGSKKHQLQSKNTPRVFFPIIPRYIVMVLVSRFNPIKHRNLDIQYNLHVVFVR